MCNLDIPDKSAFLAVRTAEASSVSVDLMGRTALVTGATSGIGRSCGLRFANAGMRVILAGRRDERLKRLQEEMAESAHVLTLDVREREHVAQAISGVPKEFSRIDVLVNCAGLALGICPANEADLDDWSQMIDTNCWGLVACTRAVLPGMVSRGRGHIVNIGSIAGRYPYPGGNVYGATKAFVHQFSMGLSSDLLGTGVRVTVIEPGMVRTEFSKVRLRDDEKADAIYEKMTPLTPDDIADAILWSINRPPHVNVSVLELLPLDQACGPFAVHRSSLR